MENIASHSVAEYLSRMVVLWRIAAVLALFAAAAPASAQLRVMNYNYAHLGGDAAALQQVVAAAHADNKFGWAKPVDLFLFQEVTVSTVGTLQSIINGAAPSGSTYNRATFTSASGEDSASGAQCAFYRVQTLTENVGAHADIFTQAGRYCDRWNFTLNGYSSSAASLYVFGTHLKASLGSEEIRETGALAIRANANALGAGVRAIYTGDLNLYVNTEPAYLAFLAAGNGQAFDMLGSGAWTGSANAIKHTQSPRLVTGGLVGGGVDDRFDFQLITANLDDGEGISFIDGTYRTLGNDGNHYNLAINSGNNSYYPSDIARSNALAAALHEATDHMPVIVDYQVPAVMSASMSGVAARLIQGASATATVQVTNIASVVTPVGSDELNFTASATTGLIGSVTAIAPLAPAFASAILQINTGVVGTIALSATATSPSEAVQNPSIVVTGSCTVVGHARPSWQSSSQSASTTIPVAVTVGGTAVDIDVPLHNFAYTTLQSKLDADYFSVPAGSAVSRIGSLPQAIAGTAGVVRLRVNPTGLLAGVTTVNGTLLVSDEDIPGEGDATLSFSVVITATGTTSPPGDINNDGSVNGADLAMLLSQWGGPGSADLNSSGGVDGADLSILLSNWG